MAGRVAVTGATGFVGRRLVGTLARRGWRVRALARRPAAAAALAADEGGAVEVVPGSVDDRGSLRRLVRGADAVVHAAGLVKARSRAEFFRVNADGTRRVVEAATEQPRPPRFVLVSSLAAREPGLSAYAASKRAGEAALAEAGAALDWTVLRPPAVYGPGDRQTLPFFRCVRWGFGPMLGAEAARFSLLHVDDLAAAVATVLEGGDAKGRVCEPDDGRPGGHSWRAVVGAAGAALGVRPRAVPVPEALLHAAAALGAAVGWAAARPVALTPGKVREIRHADWVCDAATMTLRTPWRPAFPLQEGFADAVGWYRRRGWL